MNSQKIDLLSLLPAELEEFLISLGEPKYRAKQLFTQMHRCVSPADMTNIGKSTKQKLDEVAYYSLPSIRRKLVSAIDGTVKYLFELSDGNSVESVVMKYKHGNTICVSSQVGCRMGCAFCASTIGGKLRDLAPSEILGQVLVAQNDTGERISNIVMMGIGEPLDNYQNVIKFLRLVGCEDGMNIGYRHISLSTCGLVDKIDALAKEDMPITLSISLHAPNDAIRSSMMKVNKKWGVDELLAACKEYQAVTTRRISFEYALIEGVNDSDACADELAKKLHGIMCHVNLIPANPVKENSFKKPDMNKIIHFKEILIKKGINATVRRTLGADIDASCGQLRRKVKEGSCSANLQ